MTAPSVTPSQVRCALLLRDEIALLDVRHEAAFATGHPLFAANMAADRIALEAAKRPAEQKKVLDVGPIQATKQEHHTVPLPPILGALALIGGVIILVSDRKIVWVALRAMAARSMFTTTPACQRLSAFSTSPPARGNCGRGLFRPTRRG